MLPRALEALHVPEPDRIGGADEHDRNRSGRRRDGRELRIQISEDDRRPCGDEFGRQDPRPLGVGTAPAVIDGLIRMPLVAQGGIERLRERATFVIAFRERPERRHVGLRLRSGDAWPSGQRQSSDYGAPPHPTIAPSLRPRPAPRGPDRAHRPGPRDRSPEHSASSALTPRAGPPATLKMPAASRRRCSVEPPRRSSRSSSPAPPPRSGGRSWR